jgi:hypothetical protein
MALDARPSPIRPAATSRPSTGPSAGWSRRASLRSTSESTSWASRTSTSSTRSWQPSRTLKPRSRGRDSNGATLGTQTVRPLATQTVRELELLQLDKADPSEWTGVPDDVRAQVAALQGGTHEGHHRIRTRSRSNSPDPAHHDHRLRRVTEIETVEVEVPVQKPSTTSSCSTSSDNRSHPTRRRHRLRMRPSHSPAHRDPLAGIALYVGKYYDGDACSAYMHQVRTWLVLTGEPKQPAETIPTSTGSTSTADSRKHSRSANAAQYAPNA